MSLTLLSSDASLLAVELPLGLDDSGGGGDDDLIIDDDDGRSVMDLIFSVGGGGGRLGSCRFDGDLTGSQVSMEFAFSLLNSHLGEQLDC